MHKEKLRDYDDFKAYLRERHDLSLSRFLVLIEAKIGIRLSERRMKGHCKEYGQIAESARAALILGIACLESGYLTA